MATQEVLPTGFHLSEVEQKAYELLARKRERINLDDFADLYDKKLIEEDEKEVMRLERKYDRENTPAEKELKKLAELFEVLFGKLVELEDWLGDDVFIIETSKFDDYKNGVDMVAEFLRDGLSTQLGLAVDITFSREALTEKIGRIAREIKEGKLPGIKYFISGNGDRGEKNNIPRVIIGTDRKTLGELAELVLDLNYLRKRKATQNTPQLSERIKETQRKLQNHPLQIELLAQIGLQLETFSKYASQIGRMDIAQKYKNILPIIIRIRDGKKNIELSPETKTRETSMLHEIEGSLDSIFPSTISID